jgi:hypothetical protein
MRQILYRLHTVHRQVLSGDLRTLEDSFSIRKVTYRLLRHHNRGGNLSVSDTTIDFFLRRVILHAASGHTFSKASTASHSGDSTIIRSIQQLAYNVRTRAAAKHTFAATPADGTRRPVRLPDYYADSPRVSDPDPYPDPVRMDPH